MKIAFTVATIVGLAATGSAFAQNVSSSATPADANAVQTAATYSQSSQPLTRAQVYADMVHAQKDGQTARLNQLYYGKP